MALTAKTLKFGSFNFWFDFAKTMQICVVKDCPNGDLKTQEQPLHFFCIPQIFADRIKWQKFSGRQFKNGMFPEHAVFCKRHFREDSVVKINDK
jgi:hypothetical protein